MNKDKTMNKNNLINGAFITSLGIIIAKILGIFYVIPFHAMITERGGALYGYAYTVYTLFMSIASAGIPLAISKLVSEYQALGYLRTKKRVFIIAKRIALLLGFISFLIIMFAAPILAKIVLGDITGVNTIEDVTLVIRVIGFAILFVPVLSIYRGYFEGHRFMSPPSISQVVEQIIRVLIIILGSIISLKFLKLSLPITISIALTGTTIGAFSSYLYLAYKKYKNKSKFNTRIRKVNEPIISNKVIIKKIFYYAIPFILIDLFKSLYNYVDMVTIVKGLVNISKYSPIDAESIYAIISTWSSKINMIVLAISTGIIVSLIPNITESIVKKEQKEVNKKINQSLSILLYLVVPMTFGISFLSKPIWSLFYGNSTYGSNILSYHIFSALFIALFTTTITILQTLKNYKGVFISLISGVTIKILFNNYLIMVFYKITLPAYFGPITASILGYLVSFIIALMILKKQHNINFENTIKNIMDILCGTLLMMIILSLLSVFIPVIAKKRIINLFIIMFYSIVGMIIYFMYSYFTKLSKKN